MCTVGFSARSSFYIFIVETCVHTLQRLFVNIRAGKRSCGPYTSSSHSTYLCFTICNKTIETVGLNLRQAVVKKRKNLTDLHKNLLHLSVPQTAHHYSTILYQPNRLIMES